VTVNGSGASAILNFTTVAPSAASIRHSNTFYALWLPVPGLVFLGLGVSSGPLRRKRWLGFAALWIVLASLVILPACGTSGSAPLKVGSSGTPAGTYLITVVGTDTNNQAPANTAPVVSITVN
jgi:hypothetical protein